MQIELESKFSSILNSKKRNANLRGNSLIISPQLSDYLKEFNLPLYFSERYPGVEPAESFGAGYSISVFNFANSYIAKAAGVEVLCPLKLPAYLVYIDENSDLPAGESLLFSLGITVPEDFRAALKLSFKFNAVLRSFFERRGSDLVSINVKFVISNDKVLINGDLTYSDLLLLPPESNRDLLKYVTAPDEKNTKKHIKFINKVLE